MNPWILMGAVVLASPVIASTASPERVARGLLDELGAHRFHDAERRFNERMRSALPKEKLEAVWSQLTAQAGALRSIDGVTLTPTAAGTLAEVRCQFAKEPLLVRVVVDSQGRVGGFFIAPAPHEISWSPPGYAHPDRFTEEPVTVGQAHPLPGTIAVPRGPGPFPAVVLVHGSGPEDADETIGGTKVFKDLAWGLASRGIAVLRYTKRTRVDPFGARTVKQEVLDGAHEAIALLRRFPRIDPRRIVVVGHSQGGYLAPRIAKENPGLSGLVILAGNTRPEPVLWVEQVRYLARLHPHDPAWAKLVAATIQAKKEATARTLAADQVLQLPFGGSVTGAYLLDLRGYHPAKLAARLRLPVLVLRGERDYQVREADFAGWARALKGHPGARLVQYPGLNHLFVTGTGQPRPEEYARPGHVAEEVIDEVAAWIAALGKASSHRRPAARAPPDRSRSRARRSAPRRPRR